ncbi:hypothetical protein BaRGS_00027187 [Batillaria attramentaria]|uniref:Uncharacterized protein n=1 Tax=Batillaria attramentaria TaxID=370345 RepID=A0ABD0K3J3_9CAEN
MLSVLHTGQRVGRFSEQSYTGDLKMLRFALVNPTTSLNGLRNWIPPPCPQSPASLGLHVSKSLYTCSPNGQKEKHKDAVAD